MSKPAAKGRTGHALRLRSRHLQRRGSDARHIRGFRQRRVRGIQGLLVVGAFLDCIDKGKGLLPETSHLPYDPVLLLKSAPWRHFMVEMVEGELRELTNQLNHWGANLRRWCAWNKVLKPLPDLKRWEAEWQWVEPLAFHCMFQPSASRDRFTLIATNALHQARLVLDPSATDELLGDAGPADERGRFPSRRRREGQLEGLAKQWSAGAALVQAIRQIDTDAHRQATYDYRNLASHAIAPRFSVGITSTVTRERVKTERLEEQADGSLLPVPVPGKYSARYAIGGTEPLKMGEVWECNLGQFERARDAFNAYVALLDEVTAAMSQANGASAAKGTRQVDEERDQS